MNAAAECRRGLAPRVGLVSRRTRPDMPLGWYSELQTVERRAFWACFAGFGLDAMDSTI
jgi:hypothetical protein